MAETKNRNRCQVTELALSLTKRKEARVSLLKTAGEEPQGADIENDFRQEETLPA